MQLSDDGWVVMMYWWECSSGNFARVIAQMWLHKRDCITAIACVIMMANTTMIV